MSILLIDNYDSFTYNLYQMVQALTDFSVLVHRNDAIAFDQVMKLAPSRIILSPGPGHPSVAKDFGVCRDVINRYDELPGSPPLLGVCLGHQGLVHCLGGDIDRAPAIVHGKVSRVVVTEDSPLFVGLSNPFEAMRYHSLSAFDDTMPECLRVTARTQKDDLVMAIQHRQKPLYGVQFHPESIGTPEGEMLLQNFLSRC